ncbi:esterase/lipase family protein [Streptomyces sp. NPDC091027]|uniref:esterase/lipase family protein n=1 Tax=Streptomyces sp. NPDC091027 TaxID=3365971 RepID=UPI00380C71D8
MKRKHLVYVLPGIGGSVLERPAVGKKSAETVWDAGFGDITSLLMRPDRLAIDEPLRPVGLIRSKRLLPGWTVVPGYERQCAALQALPGVVMDVGHPDHRNPDANVVLFPYDFRLGVGHAAKLLAADVHERLKGYGEAERAGRVVILAHSMGGLVARYWLGPLEGWPLCRALVTLGTPHRGAPKALQTLVNGVRVAGMRLDGVSDLLRQWPSVAELLPRYPMIGDTRAGTALYPHELPLDGLGSLAEAGFAMHREIEEAWRQMPRTGAEPQVVPRLGWSHGTAGSATWDGRKLTVNKSLPTWLDLEGWEKDHGDGTVPAISAVPVELSGHDASRDWRTRDRHGPIAAAGWIPGLAQVYETRKTLLAARGDEREAALGLDLDELHGVGEPIPLQVRLRGDSLPEAISAAPASLALWATVRATEGARTPVAEVRLNWDEITGSYVAELPGQPPGLVDIEVAAQAVPGVGDLEVSDTVAVVAP